MSISFNTEKLRSLLSAQAPNASQAVPSSLSTATAASSAAPPPASVSSSASLAASVPAPASSAVSAAVDSLLRTYELPVEASALDQIELCMEAALVCARSGSMRRFGFFLVQAAGLYQELHQHAACTALLQAVQPLYGLQPVVQDEDGSDQRTGSAEVQRLLAMSAERRQERGESGEHWVTLQKSILEHLIYTAHKTKSRTQLPLSALRSRMSSCAAALTSYLCVAAQTRCCLRAARCSCCLPYTLSWTCSIRAGLPRP